MRAAIVSLGIAVAALTAWAQSAKPSYEDSLVLAPLYIEYTSVSADKFAAEATELRRRIDSCGSTTIEHHSWIARSKKPSSHRLYVM